MSQFLKDLLKRYPKLNTIEESIFQAYSLIESAFCENKTLFSCGNGGSASDSEHISGELMKGFILKRPLPDHLKERFLEKYGVEGEEMAEKLQMGKKAVSLTSHPALLTAFQNDVDPSLCFAQQLFILGSEGDVFIGISTSGNSGNVYKSFQVASVMNMKTILLTGMNGGRCSDIVDLSIKVPETEAYKVQELHLPIYHTMCMMLEERFYGEKK